MKDFNRRTFLRGVGGVTMGLPALDVFRAHEARAQGVQKKVYSVFMLQANGVVQQWNKEPEMFWPSTLGPLSDEAMATTDADRATSELRGYASKLIMIRGIKYGSPGNGCGHSGGCNQVLTAAKVSSVPRGNKSLPMGESLDNRIARVLTPTKEPLALYAGPKSGYLDDAFSYRVPAGVGQPATVRAADNNPWNAYQRMLGLTAAAAADPAAAQLLATRRKSINDLLRGQIQSLQRRTDLSRHDRQRLDLHFSSVRDLELSMIKTLGAMDVAALQMVNGKHTAHENVEAVTNIQSDLLAFALASDMARTATLQIGTGNSSVKYTVDGVMLPSFHQISHRIYSDGAEGETIPDAHLLHHKIDRIHGRHFKHLLDRLSAYTLPEGGTLLDSTVAVWCNSLSNGPPHGYTGVPYIIAGSGGGLFKTGQYVDAKNATNNKLFNSILAAVGVRKENGDPVDDFGDPTLAKGTLTAIHT